jgi:hypothetical protein
MDKTGESYTTARRRVLASAPEQDATSASRTSRVSSGVKAASKTISVPAERLFAAFDDAELRERWLPGAGLTVRKATAPKAFRADWADASRIAVGFVAKGDAKAQVAVLHEKLADAEAAARMKEYWRERLAELKRLAENRVTGGNGTPTWRDNAMSSWIGPPVFTPLRGSQAHTNEDEDTPRRDPATPAHQPFQASGRRSAGRTVRRGRPGEP